jgi:phospholipid-binding lipoprotein MlaA
MFVVAASPAVAVAGGLRPSSDAPAAEDVAASIPSAAVADAPDPDLHLAAPAPVRADPWERQNRRFFRMNEGLDARVVRPAALGYEHHTPGPLRAGLRNVLTNLSEPVVLANDVLQLRLKRAGVTAFRFVANTTVGVLGLFDVASRAGAPHHSNGFGTTLGRYRVPPGPYVYLPLLGPSTVRDMVGSGVDGVMDPFSWARYGSRVAIATSKTVVDGLDTRARADGDLRALLDTATDPYATLRSVYLQNRQTEIEGDLGGAQRALPDFDDPPTPQSQPKGSPPKDAKAAEAAPSTPTVETERDLIAAPPNSQAAAMPTVFDSDQVQRTTTVEDRSGDDMH